MLIFVPRDARKNETRIPLIPEHCASLVKLGAIVEIESGMGKAIHCPDSQYTEMGASIANDPKTSANKADIILRLNEPEIEHIEQLKEGAIHISYLNPFFKSELSQKMAECKVSAISMEMIPRTTLAQKMDALSSQANLAGYVAVILAASKIDTVFPMMMTPAGTITPSRVFIIGVGVAGLQAIATAKRLGARVEAFDTRPVVEEQVKSLGAKFVKIDLGETGQTKDGYAQELTEAQLKKQREAMARACQTADIVITTAQLFGRKAPLIITEEIIQGMKPGSIIIDLAVTTGGNVAGSKIDEEVIQNGVRILGLSNFPGEVPIHASQMYSANLEAFISHFWDKENNMFKLNLEDEILNSCVVTHNGVLRNPVK